MRDAHVVVVFRAKPKTQQARQQWNQTRTRWSATQFCAQTTTLMRRAIWTISKALPSTFSPADHLIPTSSHDVAQEIKVRFGLTIPDLVVGKILRRPRINNLVEGNPQSGFVITERRLKEIPQVGKLADNYKRKQAELVAKFRAYATEHHTEHVGLLETDLAENSAAISKLTQCRYWHRACAVKPHPYDKLSPATTT